MENQKWKAEQDTSNSIRITNKKGKTICDIVNDSEDTTEEEIIIAEFITKAPETKRNYLEAIEALKQSREMLINKGYKMKSVGLKEINNIIDKAEKEC